MDCLHWHMPAFTAGWSPSLSLEMSSWTAPINCKLKPNTLHETNLLRPWTYAILKRKEVVIFQPIEKIQRQVLGCRTSFDTSCPILDFASVWNSEVEGVLFLRCPERCHSAALFYIILYCKYLHYKFVCNPNGPLDWFRKQWIHASDLLSIVSASEQQVVFLLLLNRNDKQIFSSRIVCNSFCFDTRLTKALWR